MTSLRSSLRAFDPDAVPDPALALHVDVSDSRSEVPVHSHRKGQLVLALGGGLICEVPDALWMAPPHCAVWVPGGVPHSNRTTANAQVYFLFVEPDAAPMPQECCTLSITPLVREMIRHFAGLPRGYAPGSPVARLAGVLLEELARMPVERLHLPMSDEPRLRRIARSLSEDPADRSTLCEWGRRVAMSERSLARLVVRETGLTFGRWRQQMHLILALRQLSAGRSVQQVSGDLGYESVTAFITMFKKALGTTPARYFAAIRRAAER